MPKILRHNQKLFNRQHAGTSAVAPPDATATPKIRLKQATPEELKALKRVRHLVTHEYVKYELRNKVCFPQPYGVLDTDSVSDRRGA